MNAILVEYAAQLFVILFVGLAITPIIHYLLNGWVARRHEILAAVPDGAVQEYLKTFFPTDLDELRRRASGTAKEAEIAPVRKFFEEHYHRRFGRRHFALGGVMFLSVLGFMLVLVGRTLSFWLGQESSPRLALPVIAVAAVAGAYVWVVYDLIRRARQRDLSPGDLFSASFRFVVAVPLAFAIGALFTEKLGVAAALMLGAFPTRTLFKITRRLGAEQLGLRGYAEESARELERLQGIGRLVAERFADEGVSTILQLAYADPVDLTIRTNFTFSYVVDCCSQALAWLYFEDNLAKIRPFGLRGAMEIRTLVQELDQAPEDDRAVKETEDAKRAVDLVADRLEVNPVALERSLREIAEDPYTSFLTQVWQWERE